MCRSSQELKSLYRPRTDQIQTTLPTTRSTLPTIYRRLKSCTDHVPTGYEPRIPTTRSKLLTPYRPLKCLYRQHTDNIPTTLPTSSTCTQLLTDTTLYGGGLQVPDAHCSTHVSSLVVSSFSRFQRYPFGSTNRPRLQNTLRHWLSFSSIYRAHSLLFVPRNFQPLPVQGRRYISMLSHNRLVSCAAAQEAVS